jgi:hypothetical protein
LEVNRLLADEQKINKTVEPNQESESKTKSINIDKDYNIKNKAKDNTEHLSAKHIQQSFIELGSLTASLTLSSTSSSLSTSSVSSPTINKPQHLKEEATQKGSTKDNELYQLTESVKPLSREDYERDLQKILGHNVNAQLDELISMQQDQQKPSKSSQQHKPAKKSRKPKSTKLKDESEMTTCMAVIGEPLKSPKNSLSTMDENSTLSLTSGLNEMLKDMATFRWPNLKANEGQIGTTTESNSLIKNASTLNSILSTSFKNKTSSYTDAKQANTLTSVPVTSSIQASATAVTTRSVDLQQKKSKKRSRHKEKSRSPSMNARSHTIDVVGTEQQLRRHKHHKRHRKRQNQKIEDKLHHYDDVATFIHRRVAAGRNAVVGTAQRASSTPISRCSSRCSSRSRSGGGGGGISASVKIVNILGKDIIKLPSHLEREIKIKKNFDPLGIQSVDCQVDEGINGCQVLQIDPISACGKDKRIRIGDYLLYVNNEQMRNLSNSSAKAILNRASLTSTDVV